MNRKLTSALLAAALVAVAGCGDKAPPPPAAKGGDAAKPAAGGEAPAAGGSAYDAAKSTGSVKITVKWAGAAPPANPKNLVLPTGDGVCVAAHPSGFPNDRFVVNADGTLPHAFVSAAEGPHKTMTGFPAPAAFVLDQKGCRYDPHVFGVRVGQNFTIKNSDGTTHNVKATPKINAPFNKSQSTGAQDEFSFGKKEGAIAIGCDVHSWMSAKGFAVEHPFFGTTAADGTVTITGLPAGKYKFSVWHENMVATPEAVTGSVEVEVKDGPVEATVTLK